MQNPVDHLRRAARTPVVTPGAASSSSVAKFAEGGATEETPEARAARLLIERRREEEDLRNTIPPEPGLPPRPSQPTVQRPAAELPVGQPVNYQPNIPASPLLSQLRERLTESAVPSQGESFRQQLMALGAGMAGSQSRHFAGAMSEGVRAMQQQEQQQQTNQRQLLETEATARYREAVVELQRAEQAAARDPNDPRNIERLAHARYYLAQAAAAGARGAGGAGAIRASAIPGSYFEAAPGVVHMVVQDRQGGITSVPVPGMRPENIPGAEGRLATTQERADRRDDRLLALQERAENNWITRRHAASTAAETAATNEMLVGPRRRAFIQERLQEFEREFPRPTSLRLRAETSQPAPAAAPEGRTIDFNR